MNSEKGRSDGARANQGNFEQEREESLRLARQMKPSELIAAGFKGNQRELAQLNGERLSSIVSKPAEVATETPENKVDRGKMSHKLGAFALAVVLLATVGTGTYLKMKEKDAHGTEGDRTEYAEPSAEEGEKLIEDTSGYVGLEGEGKFAVQLEDKSVIINPDKTGPYAYGVSLGRDEATGRDIDKLSIAEIQQRGGSVEKYYKDFIHGFDGEGEDGMFYSPASIANFVDILPAERRAAFGITDEMLKDKTRLENFIEAKGPEGRYEIADATRDVLEMDYDMALEIINRPYYTSLVKGTIKGGALVGTEMVQSTGNGPRVCIAFTPKVRGEGGGDGGDGSGGDGGDGDGGKKLVAISCHGQVLTFRPDGTPIIEEDPDPTPTPDITPTPTPEDTPSPTPEVTPTPTPEETPEPTPTATNPPTEAPTPTINPSKSGDPNAGGDVVVDTNTDGEDGVSEVVPNDVEEQPDRSAEEDSALEGIVQGGNF